MATRAMLTSIGVQMHLELQQVERNKMEDKVVEEVRSAEQHWEQLAHLLNQKLEQKWQGARTISRERQQRMGRIGGRSQERATSKLVLTEHELTSFPGLHFSR